MDAMAPAGWRTGGQIRLWFARMRALRKTVHVLVKSLPKTVPVGASKLFSNDFKTSFIVPFNPVGKVD